MHCKTHDCSRAPPHQRHASTAPYRRKFGNPLIWKILVVMWLSVHTYVRLYTNTLKTKSSTITIATFFILGVHAIVYWQLSQQAIHWPVSHDYIAGSGLELIEVVCVLKVDHWPVTGLPIGSQAQVTFYSLVEKEGVLAKAKFWCKLTPDTLLTFLLTYSLYNHLLESPWYIAYVISPILVRIVGRSLLKVNWKK